MGRFWDLLDESFYLIAPLPPGIVKRKRTVGIFEGCLFKGRAKAIPVMELRKKFRGFVGGSAYGNRRP